MFPSFLTHFSVLSRDKSFGVCNVLFRYEQVVEICIRANIFESDKFLKM